MLGLIEPMIELIETRSLCNHHSCFLQQPRELNSMLGLLANHTLQLGSLTPCLDCCFVYLYPALQRRDRGARGREGGRAGEGKGRGRREGEKRNHCQPFDHD